MNLSKFVYRKKQIYTIVLALIILMVTFGCSMLISRSDAGTIRFYSFLTIIEFVVSIALWYSLYHEILAPIPLTLFSLYLFNLGLSVPWIQNYAYYSDISSSIELIIKAQNYLLLCMNMFFVGCLLFNRRLNDDTEKNNDNTIEEAYSGKALKSSSMIVMCISIVPYLINIYTLLINSISRGYSYIYSSEYTSSSSTLIATIGNLFEPALLGVVVSTKPGDKKRKVYIGVVFLTIIVKFFIGGRASGVAMALAIVMLFYFENKKIKFKQLILYILLGYFLLVMISTTKYIRSMSGRTIENYIAAVTSANNVINEIFVEFGGSIKPTIYTMTFVPSEYPYRYGYTYLFSLLSIIPNLGFWDVHPAEKYSALASWITRVANHTWSGLGYSSTAESYINFGELGCFVFVLWGYFISKIVFICKDTIYNRTIKRYILVSAFLCLFYSFVRGDFRDMIRAFTWRVLPLLLLYMLIHRGINGRIKDN